MSRTEKLIRELKRTVNPATGEGWEYKEIGELLGFSLQRAHQHVNHQRGECPKCLRKLKRNPKLKTI